MDWNAVLRRLPVIFLVMSLTSLWFGYILMFGDSMLSSNSQPGEYSPLSPRVIMFATASVFLFFNVLAFVSHRMIRKN